MQMVGRLDASDYIEVVYRHEWTDYDDWDDKYGAMTNPQAFASVMRLLRYYRQLGVLARARATNYQGVVIDLGRNLNPSYRCGDKTFATEVFLTILSFSSTN